MNQHKVMITSTLSIFMRGIGIGLGDVPFGQDAAAQWETDMLDKVASLSETRDEEPIEELGTILRKLSRKSFIGGDEKTRVHAAAQKAVIEIPGHAEWYRDDILNRFDLWERTEGQYGTYTANWNHFIRFRNWNFTTLKEMPSPETVRVLGEMLGTEEDGYEKEKTPDYNLDFWAAGTLSVLGIESPPSPPDPNGYWRWAQEHDLKTWRLWYGQVKAGTRTFSFEGDPQQYNLDGPVRFDADSSPRPRQSEDSPLPETALEETRRTFPWFPLGIALAVLGFAVARWLRNRPTRTAA